MMHENFTIKSPLGDNCASLPDHLGIARFGSMFGGQQPGGAHGPMQPVLPNGPAPGGMGVPGMGGGGMPTGGNPIMPAHVPGQPYTPGGPQVSGPGGYFSGGMPQGGMGNWQSLMHGGQNHMMQPQMNQAMSNPFLQALGMFPKGPR